MQFNASTPEALRKIHTTAFRTLPAITSAGYTGYGLLADTFSGIFLLPDGTNSTFDKAFAPLAAIANTTGIQAELANFDLPSWKACTEAFVTDPNIATNIIGASRLLTDKVLTDDAAVAALSDMAGRDGAAFNFIGKISPSADRAATAAHDVWCDSAALISFGEGWDDDASESVKREKKQHLVALGEELGGIIRSAGQEEGTYVNEANPYERKWKEVFWGRKYERLERIRRKVDPKGLFGWCNRCVGGRVVLEP